MKIGLTSLTFRNEDIQTVFEYAHKANVEGIEWGVCDKHIRIKDAGRAELVKKLSDENNIEIFSLGSYCYMTDFEECESTLETAAMLKAPVIRLWAGKLSSSECCDDYYSIIVENTKKMAERAERYSISLGFEYHQNTLTDNSESAIKLINAVGRKNVGLYWQPQHTLTYEENLVEIEEVASYILKNIHLNNYSREHGYGYLSDIYEQLSGYLTNVKESDYNILIEFVKNASVDSLLSDVSTVRKIISQRDDGYDSNRNCRSRGYRKGT